MLSNILKDGHGNNRLDEIVGTAASRVFDRAEHARHRRIVAGVRRAAVGQTAGHAREMSATARQEAEAALQKYSFDDPAGHKVVMTARYRQHEWDRIAALMERDGLRAYDPDLDNGEIVRAGT